MRAFHASLLVGAAVALMGCTRESPPGGPGAKTTTTTKTTTDGTIKTTEQQTEKRDEIFKVEVPKGGTNVTQGKSEKITISLSRGDNFNETVNLKFAAPAGLKVVPPDVSIKRGETKTNVTVEAADDAMVGRHSITVTGSPESGKSTSVNMDIDVKKKG